MVGRRTLVGEPVRRLGGLVTAVLVILAGCVVVLAGATPAYGCECEPITRAEAVEEADVILFGTVRTIRAVSDPESGRELLLDVRYVYKGTAYAEQVVQTPADEACGFSATPGTTMVVFATTRSDPATEYAYELISTQCAGNLVTDSAPRGLGAPEPPMPGSSAEVGAAERINDLIGRILLGIGLGAVGLAFVVGTALFWLWRPDRPAR